MNSIPYRGVRG